MVTEMCVRDKVEVGSRRVPGSWRMGEGFPCLPERVGDVPAGCPDDTQLSMRISLKSITRVVRGAWVSDEASGVDGEFT